MDKSRQMVTENWFNIGSGLLPDSTKLLPEQILTSQE